MIPAAELSRIRARFQGLKGRVRIDFFSPKDLKEPPVLAMLQDLASVSPRIALTVHEFEPDSEAATKLNVDKAPAIVIRGQANRPLRYYGSPSQHQFAVFLETLVAASTGAVELEEETVRQLRRLRSDVNLRVLVMPSCKFSPVMAFNALRFGLQSVRVKVDVIDVSEFPFIIQQVGVPAVPVTIINDQYGIPGVVSEGDLAKAVLQAAEGEEVKVNSRPKTVTMLAARQPRPQPPGPRRTSSGLILPR